MQLLQPLHGLQALLVEANELLAFRHQGGGVAFDCLGSA
jgi:hypothetical protein